MTNLFYGIIVMAQDERQGLRVPLEVDLFRERHVLRIHRERLMTL